MIKYAFIINNETKQVSVCGENQIEHFKSCGYTAQEVEQGYDGLWYLAGYAPQKPEETYQEKRKKAYPEIPEQLDMIYWDKINGTHHWEECITNIKNTYPKTKQ